MKLKANQTVTLWKQRNKRIPLYFHFLAYKHLTLLPKRVIYSLVCIYQSSNTCNFTDYGWKIHETDPKIHIFGWRVHSQLRCVTSRFQNQLVALLSTSKPVLLKVGRCFWLLSPVRSLMPCTTHWVRKGLLSLTLQLFRIKELSSGTFTLS